MLIANLVTAVMLTQAPPTHGAPANHGPAPVTAPAAPMHGMAGHDGMMNMEGDRSIPGDSPKFKNVELKIVSPKEGEVVPGTDMEVRFELKNYELPGEGPGPHIHVIIDNQPYVPDYDASKPFKVTGLSPGPHTLRAFPSRPWHESIKAPKAFALTHFFVGAKTSGKNLPNWADPKKPLLTFSRPKGNYAGEDAKNIMIDFWLSNAKLGPKDYSVKMILDGQAETITKWAPIWKAGLADGPHKIQLDLLDKKGRPVENAFNHTEREFTVNAPATTAAPASPTPTAPAASPTPAPAPAPSAPPAGK